MLTTITTFRDAAGWRNVRPYDRLDFRDRVVTARIFKNQKSSQHKSFVLSSSLSSLLTLSSSVPSRISKVL